MTRAIHCSMDLGLSNLVRVFLDIYSKANDNFLKSGGLLTSMFGVFGLVFVVEIVVRYNLIMHKN